MTFFITIILIKSFLGDVVHGILGDYAAFGRVQFTGDVRIVCTHVERCLVAICYVKKYFIKFAKYFECVSWLISKNYY